VNNGVIPQIEFDRQSGEAALKKKVANVSTFSSGG